MTPEEINVVVVLSDEQYDTMLQTYRQVETDAYQRYAGVSKRPEPGSPALVGLGTQIGGFIGQAEWLKAAQRLKDVLLCRTASNGQDEGWRALGDGRYRLVGIQLNDRRNTYDVEIVTHGVDVSDCPTPTEALRKVVQERGKHGANV